LCRIRTFSPTSPGVRHDFFQRMFVPDLNFFTHATIVANAGLAGRIAPER
jgi:hypothetical protein